MFGSEYSNHLEVLVSSFGGMSKDYEEKTKKDSRFFFLGKIKEIYISIFGVPEIGFQLRSLYFTKIISKSFKNKNFKKILDAGCGIGMYSFLLAKTFPEAEIAGIDIDSNKLKSCEAIAKELEIKNIEFTYLNLLKLPKFNYDLIVNIDVLEHIDDYELVLKNFYNLLNKGGYLYIHVPQPNQERIFSLLKNWYHKGHVHEGISKIDLERNLKNLNFKIIASKETFGFFGKLAWELNHIMLLKSFALVAVSFPFLYILALLDLLLENKHGLGIAILVQR